jgi:hypothetical protein
MKKVIPLMALAAAALCSTGAHADQLDDIIGAGKLRCAVELDFPPNGSRDANNNPIGFDVDYCNDLGKALGVEVEIVDTPESDRIPRSCRVAPTWPLPSLRTPWNAPRRWVSRFPTSCSRRSCWRAKSRASRDLTIIKGHPVGGPAGAYETLALAEQVKMANDPRRRC